MKRFQKDRVLKGMKTSCNVKMRGGGILSGKERGKCNKFQRNGIFYSLLLFLNFAMPFNSSAADIDISTVADPATKIYTRTSGNGDNYYNSEEDTTYTLQFQTTGGSAGSQSGKVSGNIQLIMDLGCDVRDASKNGTRLSLSSTNDFSGGLVLKNGILHASLGTSLGASNGTITMDKGVLMSGYSGEAMDLTQGILLADNSWGGLRASRNINVTGNVTGNGDLVIVTEDNFSVTLSNSGNDYTGVTSVGTVRGGVNFRAILTLGADNVLPTSTILEIGKSQNETYNYESSTSEVRLNGTSNTVGGLYGVGNVNGPGTLNINVANGEEYTFSGSFGTTGTVYADVAIGGEGKQIFDGTKTMQLKSLKVENSQLEINRAVENTVEVGSLTLTDGTIDLQGYLTVSGGFTTSGVSKITNTSATTSVFHKKNITADVTLDTSVLDGNIRLVLEGNQNIRAQLGPNQSYTGGITIINMAVRPNGGGHGNFLGVVPTEYKADAILLDGGTIQNTSNSLTIAANQGITVTENGGSIRMGNAGELVANIYSVITGDGWFGVTADQALEVILHAANSYRGETRLGTTLNQSGGGNSAILVMGAANVLPSTSDIVFGRTGTAGSNLRLKGFDQSVGALISRENGLSDSVAGAVADMGLISSTDSVTLTIGNANASGTYTEGYFTGAIQNTGGAGNSISLIKVGTGKQILGGTLENTRTDLTVQGGTVELAKSADKYAVRNLTLTNGTVTLTGDGGNQIGGNLLMSNGTVLEMNGKSEAVNYLHGSGTVQNSGTALSVLTTNGGTVPTGETTSTNATFSGKITGNIRLVKEGGGRQVLQGANDYSGGTLIRNGILYAGGGNLGTGTIELDGGTLMNGGTATYAHDIVLASGKNGNLRAGGGDTGVFLTFLGDISGEGTLVFNQGEGNGGSFILAGNNTYTGGTLLTGGGVSFTPTTQRMNYYSVTAQSDTALGTGTITVNPNSGHTVGIVWDTTLGTRKLSNNVEIQNGRTLEFTKTGENEAVYTGLISGNGSLVARDMVFEFDLAALTETTLWDLSGTANLEDITLRILAESPNDYVGQTFQLFGDNATVEGLAAAILDFSSAGGNQVWNYGFTDSGNVWFQVDSAAIPEPSTWCLLLLGGLLMGRFSGKFSWGRKQK